MVLRLNLLITLLFLVVFSSIATAQNKSSAGSNNKGISFIENSWPAALKKAKAEHKYIFVDAYASWCGPCKQLKATTFKDSKAADFFNKTFVNLTIDTEKGQGIELAEAWGLESYPTLYVFDPNGKLISGHEGFLNAADLIKFAQQAIKK